MRILAIDPLLLYEPAANCSMLPMCALILLLTYFSNDVVFALDNVCLCRSLRAAVDEYLTRVTRESRGKAGKERAETERLQEDADRLKR